MMRKNRVVRCLFVYRNNTPPRVLNKIKANSNIPLKLDSGLKGSLPGNSDTVAVIKIMGTKSEILGINIAEHSPNIVS
jgi:hypothetical protein